MAIQLPESRELLASTWELKKVESETLTTVEKALDLALSNVQTAMQKRKDLEGKRAALIASLDQQTAQEKAELSGLASTVTSLAQQIASLYIESELSYLQTLTKSKIDQCVSEIKAARAKLDGHTHTLHYVHNQTCVDLPTSTADYPMGGARRLGKTDKWQTYRWFEKV